MAEIAELLEASDGRALGLFSSRRAAETAAVYARKRLPALTILCQGDAQLPDLTRRFIQDENASLFGTLSLWQGPTCRCATCQLVIIDRIPSPRPDEPLTVARQRAVAEAGGNGFMKVAASHAALLRRRARVGSSSADRQGVGGRCGSAPGSARYGSFPKASMPDMWQTTDRQARSRHWPPLRPVLGSRSSCTLAEGATGGAPGGGVDPLARLRYGAHVHFDLAVIGSGPGGQKAAIWRPNLAP